MHMGNTWAKGTGMQGTKRIISKATGVRDDKKIEEKSEFIPCSDVRVQPSMAARSSRTTSDSFWSCKGCNTCKQYMQAERDQTMIIRILREAGWRPGPFFFDEGF